jgi:hypothetical protein
LLADHLADLHDDPGGFHESILGRPAFHPKQEEIAQSVFANRVTVVPAAHSVGKSWGAASIALAWLYTRPGSKVVTTSASNNQLLSVLWGNIKGAHARSAVPLSGRISVGNAIPQRLALGPEWYAIGFSAARPESFSGFHGEDILVIADEASGISQPIWDAIESLGYAALLALGNPLRATGHFKALYDLCLAGTPGYKGIHLTAFDSPHAGLDDEQVKALGLPPGLTTRTWIEGVRRTYGEGSLYWLTRVLARFPTFDNDQLLPREWVDRCVTAVRKGAGPRSISVDISKGSGRDRTVILVGDLLGLIEVIFSNKVGVKEAAELVRDLSLKHGVAHDRIVYDAGGWAGSDMTRYLEQYGIRAAVRYFGNDKGFRRHANKRARSAWQLRLRLDPERPLRPMPVADDPGAPEHRRPRMAIEVQPPFQIPPGPHWGEMREELLELRYRHDGPKIALEKKEDMVLRLGRSPDLCDGLLMMASLWAFDE